MNCSPRCALVAGLLIHALEVVHIFICLDAGLDEAQGQSARLIRCMRNPGNHIVEAGGRRTSLRFQLPTPCHPGLGSSWRRVLEKVRMFWKDRPAVARVLSNRAARTGDGLAASASRCVRLCPPGGSLVLRLWRRTSVDSILFLTKS